jgi:hypothetical protein
MKKSTLLVFIIVCLIGCKHKSRPLKIYQVVLTGKELNSIGADYDRMIKEDTIMSVDDTTAYYRGLVRYYAQLNTEKKTRNKISTTTGFEVRDSTGIDLSVILPKNVVDSLNKQVEKLAKKLWVK